MARIEDGRNAVRRDRQDRPATDEAVQAAPPEAVVRTRAVGHVAIPAAILAVTRGVPPAAGSVVATPGQPAARAPGGQVEPATGPIGSATTADRGVLTQGRNVHVSVVMIAPVRQTVPGVTTAGQQAGVLAAMRNPIAIAMLAVELAQHATTGHAMTGRATTGGPQDRDAMPMAEARAVPTAPRRAAGRHARRRTDRNSGRGNGPRGTRPRSPSRSSPTVST